MLGPKGDSANNYRIPLNRGYWLVWGGLQPRRVIYKFHKRLTIAITELGGFRQCRPSTPDWQDLYALQGQGTTPFHKMKLRRGLG